MKCDVCKKVISEDEFVVNWGSCGPCLDAHYEAYCAANPVSETTEDEDFDEPR